MPSKIDPLVTGEKYHVYNRGVDKRTIFQDKKDTLRFYNSLYLFNTIKPVTNYRLAKGPTNKSQKLVSIEAYCLLPNHFHLIVTQESDGGVGEFMRRLSTGYTSYFNQKYVRSGSLFQGTFKRKLIDSDEYYNYLFAYVNQNFLVHGIDEYEDICYSSTKHYEGVSRSRLLGGCKYDYSAKEARKLAYEIREKRLLSKKELFE